MENIIAEQITLSITLLISFKFRTRKLSDETKRYNSANISKKII